ncbi:hypothetical protein FOC1_g10009294 [Fusarium oxysporum f. sp. cubense race 1]|uniref:BTB domain-containing protein n=1 Tax=Fusarium oxysporum f. sp. cubense (strain race 1) TaxID=1229664 RepID=N4U3N5_FUSC1|nr:hypothetical protein FOC1_g10009294 [Fusarium oxysporum f. sp. cubense race 1]
MAPQSHSFLLHLVGSGEFSDFTLICKDREFKLHQVIVCPQSPVISAALHSGFEETTSKVVTVNEFHVATVQSMVTFLYTGDYVLAPETEKSVQVKDRDEKSEDGEVHSDQDKMSEDSFASSKETEDKTAEKIISYLSVNAIADYYNIAKLGKLSTSKIEAILRDDLNFLIIPQVIQEMSISNRDADLRSLIASATAKYIEELTSSQVLRALDLEHDLAIEILEACGRRIQELVEDASTARELQKIRERVSTLSIVKISSAIDLLKKTNRCRHCNNLFGCYIEEPTSVLTGGSAYVLRCESCGCRHS